MTKVNTDSKKVKYSLEFEIKSSPKILYNYLSNASGLEEWFADKVNVRNGDLIFIWEGSEQRAKIVAKKDNQMIRFKWLDDDSQDETYFQFEIIQDEITSDVALIVTDFSEPDEKEEDILLWNSQIHNLMHHIGS
ncbi:MAG: SRPBCC domain-containing protein [Bacteroidetes bacterium]|nr:MAG: SRPBCC domain-containing protein [Bacteroidota bacterium]REJ99888.1 MAG: SRPBCC domain-containing protein [Bacteroidota bacterium]REK34261.1 MAG: SRPBCC domain-containing protein [Bacteroidota bacterium]REK50591.1 MAG: SRPBCC domain-containing protein [Bacteroidota bacterium]